jgi:regulatory protein SWI5
MCIGALEGIVRKTVKRGRPRKNRPDNEERLKKSSKTRSKNKDKTVSSASSTTGYSESNASNSPRSDLDLDILDEYTYSQSSNLNHGSFEYPSQTYSSPMENTNDYVSPQQTQQAPASPSAYSQSSSSHTHSQNGSFSSTSTQHLPTHPSSPTHHSQDQEYHSPPGLCESFSSPAPSPKFYDLEMDMGRKAEKEMRLGDIAEQDDDADEMFLEAFAAAVGRDGGCDMNMSMTQLEQNPSLLLKFEDNDEMFRNEEDVFFGSP